MLSDKVQILLSNVAVITVRKLIYREPQSQFQRVADNNNSSKHVGGGR